MKKILAAIFACLMFTAPMLSHAEGGKPYKAVIQVSDNDSAKWNLALNNAKNLQKDLGKENLELEIVAYGPGINMMKFDSEVANRLSEASESGIAILACGNTMKNQKLGPTDLHSSAKVIPAGVVHIVKREKDGWAYLRP